MIKRTVVCWTILVLIAARSEAQLPEKLPADRLDGPPVVSARAWAVADGATGALLWGANDAVARPMASTTKIMTAWIVVSLAAEHAELLDETITFSERAAGTTGSSSKLKAGDRIRVHDLLYGLMLPSGNDAAVALAGHFGTRFAASGDPVEAFVAEMNRRAAGLKLLATRYSDPNGLSPGNLSTTRDLAMLTAQALKNERFAAIVRTRRHECEVTGANGEKRTVVWSNTNKLLGIDGYDGVKTGTTTPAGNCLVASGRHHGDHLIVVVLGSTSSDGKFVDARNLFRWGWLQRSAKPAGK